MIGVYHYKYIAGWRGSTMKQLSIGHRLAAVMLMLALVITGAGLTVAEAASASTVRITGYTTPKKVTLGDPFTLKGKITSNRKIKRVEIGVVNANLNKWTAQKYDNSAVNSKSFNISTADPYIRFGKLKTGKYRYRIYAHTSDGKVHIVLNDSFTVVKAAKSTASKKTTATTTKTTAAKTTKTKNPDKIKMTGTNFPGNYRVGKKFNAKGTITSSRKIKRVEIGIVFAPTNKWTEYKYDNKYVNAKTFNIANAAPNLRFDKLPGGTYYYRIYAHTSKGVNIVRNSKFTVTPSSKPKLAVKWAKKIAADDTFTYGAKPAANDLGCYFCGTNKWFKPKGYEKTYVCLTFAGAAYAHGAKDPEILRKCRNGLQPMYENDANFYKFTCWMKIGRCRDLHVEDLQVGDVIIKWSDYDGNDGHVCIYAGNNNIVESSGGGWGKDSIGLKKGEAEERLRDLAYDSRNYVMRYRY